MNMYRVEQILIGAIHILMLVWMVYVLQNFSLYTIKEVIFHFAGLSLYGALLIRGTAYWAKKRYLQEIRK